METTVFYIHILIAIIIQSIIIGNVFEYAHIYLIFYLKVSFKMPLWDFFPVGQNGVASSFVYIIGLKMAQNKRPRRFALNSLDKEGA